jgi:flagellar protein FliL
MTEIADSPPPKPSRLPLILGLVLALLLGGGGFYATYSGLLGPARAPEAEATTTPAPRGEQPGYVPVDPITINLGTRGQSRHLRFVAQLEVAPAHTAEVTRLMPRIVDVMNTYLRAVDLPELEEPAALTRIRAQMLRRIQIVTGPGRVSDLLIMEFVFN